MKGNRLSRFLEKFNTILCISAMIILALLLSCIILLNLSDFWNVALAASYIVACIIMMAILIVPNEEFSLSFNKTALISFAFWCVVAPIVAGCLVDAVLNKTMTNIQNDLVGVWLVVICVIIFSFAWFYPKIRNSECNVVRLDFYSTGWIATVSVITLADLGNKKLAFVLLLIAYFAIQMAIKAKACKFENNETNTSPKGNC